MKNILKNVSLIFSLLAIIFIPASFKIFPFQNQFSSICFGWISGDPDKFSSDTKSLFYLILILILLAILVALILNKINFWKEHEIKIRSLIQLVMVYYLASRFFVYGFDKLVKSQFFMPEPNTLYTPVGYLTKDILYWTSMGTSYWYNLLTGLFEIIPAVLLLFRKTRFTGLVLLFFILLNVLIINFGFDISVKLYSLFLLSLVIILLAPNIIALANFLKGEASQLVAPQRTFYFFYKPFVKGALKSFLIGLILLDMTYYSIQSGSFNDDLAERPPMHGAYHVNESNELNVKRFFIHRRGFFILQLEDESLLDYALQVTPANLKLTSYDGEVNKVPYQLYKDRLEIEIEGMVLVGFNLDWRRLPVLEDEFHFLQELP